MIDFYRVGAKISTCRREKNMTQEELAYRLYVTRQAVSKWENGMGIPSTDILVELSKLFCISVEEILCLDEDRKLEVALDDIFQGHDRGYIINKIVRQELAVNIPDIFYQLSPSERMKILWAIREKKISCDCHDLYVKLTISEQKFMEEYFKGEKKL